MQGFDARQREVEASEAQTMMRSRADEVFRDPDSPVGGNPEGDVTLVEFFDHNCPYCRQVAPVMAEAQAADPVSGSSIRNSRSSGRVRRMPRERRWPRIARAAMRLCTKL